MEDRDDFTSEEREESEKASAEANVSVKVEIQGKNEEKPKLTPKQTAIQVLKFVLFSCGAGIIQTIAFTLMNEIFNWNYWVSYLIALVLSVLYNFTVNRRYTFKSANNVPIAMLLVALFYCAFTPYSVWLTKFLTENKGLNEYLVLFINMAQNLTLEFLWCRFVVYRKSMNSNKIAEKDKEKERTKVEVDLSAKAECERDEDK